MPRRVIAVWDPRDGLCINLCRGILPGTPTDVEVGQFSRQQFYTCCWCVCVCMCVYMQVCSWRMFVHGCRLAVPVLPPSLPAWFASCPRTDFHHRAGRRQWQVSCLYWPLPKRCCRGASVHDGAVPSPPVAPYLHPPTPSPPLCACLRSRPAYTPPVSLSAPTDEF